jgi:hypothetical protein
MSEQSEGKAAEAHSAPVAAPVVNAPSSPGAKAAVKEANNSRRRILWARIGGYLGVNFLMFLRFFFPPGHGHALASVPQTWGLVGILRPCADAVTAVSWRPRRLGRPLHVFDQFAGASHASGPDSVWRQCVGEIPWWPLTGRSKEGVDCGSLSPGRASNRVFGTRITFGRAQVRERVRRANDSA